MKNFLFAIKILYDDQVIQPTQASVMESFKIPDPQKKTDGTYNVAIANCGFSFGKASTKVMNIAQTPEKEKAAKKSAMGM